MSLTMQLANSGLRASAGDFLAVVLGGFAGEHHKGVTAARAFGLDGRPLASQMEGERELATLAFRLETLPRRSVTAVRLDFEGVWDYAKWRGIHVCVLEHHSWVIGPVCQCHPPVPLADRTGDIVVSQEMQFVTRERAPQAARGSDSAGDLRKLCQRAWTFAEQPPAEFASPAAIDAPRPEVPPAELPPADLHPAAQAPAAAAPPVQPIAGVPSTEHTQLEPLRTPRPLPTEEEYAAGVEPGEQSSIGLAVPVKKSGVIGELVVVLFAISIVAIAGTVLFFMRRVHADHDRVAPTEAELEAAIPPPSPQLGQAAVAPDGEYDPVQPRAIGALAPMD